MKKSIKKLIFAFISFVAIMIQMPVWASDMPVDASEFIIAGEQLLNFQYKMINDNGRISSQISPTADSDYLVNIDFTVSSIGNKAACLIVYTKNDAGGMRGKHIMDMSIDENGYIGFLKTPTEETGQPAVDSCAEITTNNIVWLSCDTPVNANENINIKAYIDVNNKEITYYVNNRKVGGIELPDYAEVLPSGVGVFKDSAFQKGGHILNVTKYQILPVSKTHIKSTSFYNYEDGELLADEYGKFSPDIKKVDITFAQDVNEELLNSIQINDGTEITVFKKSQKTVEIKFNQMLKPNTEYTILNNREELVVETNAIENIVADSFVIMNNDSFETTLVSDIENGIKFSAEIYNFSSKQINAVPVINVYKDGILKETSNFESVSIEALNKGNIETSLLNYSYEEGMYITAFLITEDGMPITREYVLGMKSIENDAEWVLNYGFNANSGMNGKKVYTEIYLPGKSDSDLNSYTNISEIIAYRGIEYISDDKAYFTFKLFDDPEIAGDAISGIYPVYVTVEGMSRSKDEIPFNNLYELENAVNNVNIIMQDTVLDREEKISKIEEILTRGEYVFSLPDVYKSTDINKMNVAMIIYDMISNGEVFSKDTAEKVAEYAVTIEAVSKGLYQNLFDYGEILNLSESEIKNFYNKEYVTSEIKNKITSEMKISYSGTQDFYDKLTEKFILVTLELIDGSKHSTEIIREMYEKIGIEYSVVTDAKDSVFLAVTNKEFNDYQELLTAFNKAYRSTKTDTKPSGGGGGGGRGSSIKAPTITVAATTDKEQKNDIADNQIPYDIFDDIDSVLWAKQEIIKLAEAGIVSGKGDNKFCPNEYVTREEFIKMIVKAIFENEEIQSELYFVDVPESSWSYDYVKKGYGLGIINGYNETFFGAKDFITRQDMATVIYRSLMKISYKLENNMTKKFNDENEFAEYAIEPINMLYNNEIINGVDNSRFEATKFATRAEVAKVIYNLLNQ